jgi:hypothetical protein
LGIVIDTGLPEAKLFVPYTQPAIETFTLVRSVEPALLTIKVTVLATAPLGITNVTVCDEKVPLKVSPAVVTEQDITPPASEQGGAAFEADTEKTENRIATSDISINRIKTNELDLNFL